MRWTGSVPRKALGAGFCRVHSAPIHMGSAIVPGGEVPMKTISRLLLACAAVTFAASQAAAGEFIVTGAGGYRYRNAPPPAYAHGPWRYRRDWAPRYYAPQYHNDLGAAIAGALAGAALQLIPRATEALAARLPPPPGAPPPPPVAAPPPAPNVAPPPAAAVPPPAAPPAVLPQAELSPSGDPLDAIPDNSSNANRIT